MAGGMDDFEHLPAEWDRLAVFDASIDVRRVRGPVHDDLDAEALAHDLARRIMVRMGVGVDGVDNFRL